MYFSSIGFLLQELSKSTVKYKFAQLILFFLCFLKPKYIRNQLKIINNLMEKNHINMDLRLRIREYLRYMWKEEKTHFDEEEDLILKYLPLNLKHEFLLSSYGDILMNHSIFLTNFSKKCLNETIYQGYLREIRMAPGDVIIDVNINNFYN